MSRERYDMCYINMLTQLSYNPKVIELTDLFNSLIFHLGMDRISEPRLQRNHIELVTNQIS